MEYKIKYDALYYGILSGIIAGIVQAIYGRPFIWFHLIDSGILEHAEKILMSQDISGYVPMILGLLIHLLYSGLWGGVFALVITKYPGHEYFKGMGMGLTAWTTIMFITTTLGQHGKGQEEANHALVLAIGGALYGVATAWVFKKLTRRFHVLKK